MTTGEDPSAQYRRDFRDLDINRLREKVQNWWKDVSQILLFQKMSVCFSSRSIDPELDRIVSNGGFDIY